MPINAQPSGSGITSVTLGSWNANTNIPDLTLIFPASGQKYYVATAGTQDLGGGNITFAVGDYAVYLVGTGWVKQDATPVASETVNDSGVSGARVSNALDTLNGNDYQTNAKLANMAQSTVKGRQSGTGTGDPEDLTPAQQRIIIIESMSSKTTAVDADEGFLIDSVDGLLKRWSYTNMKATFKTYFDSLYSTLSHAARHTNGSDDIQSATNAQKGLATAAHITAIEANTAKLTANTANVSAAGAAMITGTTPVANQLAQFTSGTQVQGLTLTEQWVVSTPTPTTAGTKGQEYYAAGYQYKCVVTGNPGTWVRKAVETSW